MSMKLTSDCQRESLKNISEAASGHLHQPVGDHNQQIRRWTLDVLHIVVSSTSNFGGFSGKCFLRINLRTWKMVPGSYFGLIIEGGEC